MATAPPARYPFWLIDGKLREADFFLAKIRAEEDLDIARYYFSAFVSAARSVTFALQRCLAALANFDSWYADRQQQLKEHPTASYFKNIRNEVLHEGLNPLQGWMQGTITPRTFYLRDDAPERDVVVAATSYMAILVKITAEAFTHFWTSLDLPENFTMEDLAARGQTIEDIEEEFGYPRGWSAGRPDEERLWVMKEFSKTEIADLTARYPS